MRTILARRALPAAVAAVLALTASPATAQTASPTPSPTATASPTPSPTPSQTPAATLTPAPTRTPAATPMRTPAPRVIYPAQPRLKPSLECSSDSSTGADFNGDGADDVAIAAPYDEVAGAKQAGSLNVVYGGGDGPSSIGDQFFSPASGGLPAFKWVFGPERLFGKGMAAGDFNADGYTDLAIGAPGMPVEEVPGAGAVFVLYGTRDGLSTRYSQAIHQDRFGMPDHGDSGDSFGWSLAAGDFNGDGSDDLAVSAPGEDFGRLRDGGAVFVVYSRSGSRASGGGLSATTAPAKPQLVVQGARGLLDSFETSDMFGLALASGNFDGDANGSRAIDDLAVGVPHEDIGTKADTGAVQVVYGSSGGLTADDQFWHQDQAWVEGSNETGDLYGCALAAGAFSGLRFGTAQSTVDAEALAVGVPGEDVRYANQGGVNVLYPSAGGGLTATTGPGSSEQGDPGDQFFLEGPGLGDLGQPPEAQARFGQALNAQNIDPVTDDGPPRVTDPSWELVIGVPGADAGAGEAYVIGGVEGDGLRALESNTYLISQDSLGTHRAAEGGDEFARTIAFGDYDDDGDLDVVLGAPGDSSCGLLNETGEFLSVGPGIPLGADAVQRAGAALVLFNDGAQEGVNGPTLNLTPPGLSNWSLTRCDLVTESTTIYGLSGEPRAGAEFSHTIAGR